MHMRMQTQMDMLTCRAVPLPTATLPNCRRDLYMSLLANVVMQQCVGGGTTPIPGHLQRLCIGIAPAYMLYIVDVINYYHVRKTCKRLQVATRTGSGCTCYRSHSVPYAVIRLRGIDRGSVLTVVLLRQTNRYWLIDAHWILALLAACVRAADDGAGRSVVRGGV